MSQLRVMVDGKPDWQDQGPAYARRAGWGGSALGHFSGTVVVAKRSAVPLREKDRRRKARAQETRQRHPDD